MNKNFVVSFVPIANPLNHILWTIRQFGITYNTTAKSNKSFINFQGLNFEISYGSNLPFNGIFICIDGPKLPTTSYSRKGLIELIELIIRSEYNLKKHETTILNEQEFDLLIKNYSLDVITKGIFYTQTYNGSINLEFIEQYKFEIPEHCIYFNKYSLDKSKVNNQVFALHCIIQKGEIEFHNSTYLKIALNDYMLDVKILIEKTKNVNAEDFLTNEINQESKILRIRYNYDNIDALYFIVNPNKYILIEYYERIG